MNLAQAYVRILLGDFPHEAMCRWPAIAHPPLRPEHRAPHAGDSISNRVREALRDENGLSAHELADRTGRAYESVRCVLKRYMRDVLPQKAPDGSVTYHLVEAPLARVE